MQLIDKIILVVGGGPDTKTKDFWVKIFIMQENEDQNMVIKKNKPIDTIFSKNKTQAMKEANEQAIDLVTLRGDVNCVIEECDEVSDKDDLNNTETTYSDRYGKF